MVRRDPGGLDGAYRRYADRLYAYCQSILHDADAAADVVQETFLLASERAGQLRDPDRLRPWLYAIARHECLRVVRTRRRSASLEEAGDVVAESVDATASVQAAALRELVGAASASLSEPDREVIELSVRQGMSPAEVGAVLGLSSNHAHARMSRARTQLQRALGALLVARALRGRRGTGLVCAGLDEMLRGWDGRLTPLLRKRLSRHIDDCAVCSASQREQLEPATLLPAYAALPFLALPLLGSGRLDRLDQLVRAGSPPPTSRLRVRLGRDGFPSRPSAGRRTAVVAAGVAILLMLGGGVVAVTTARELPLAGPTGPPTGTAAAGQGPLDPGLTAPTGTPTPAVTTVAPPPVLPTPGPTTSTGLVFVVALTAAVHADPPYCTVPGFTFHVTIDANANLSTAKVYWRVGSVEKPPVSFAPSLKHAAGNVHVTAATAQWWVELKATDGRTFSTKSHPQTINKVCV